MPDAPRIFAADGGPAAPHSARLFGSIQGPSPSRSRLGLWDTTSIIVGIIIGVGIFETPSLVLRNVSGPWQGLGVWALGALLSLIGALCFAELAAAYPRSGGDYVYLTRAYGPWLGFLFAWAQLAVIRTGGGIAAPAYVFADYAVRLWNFGPFAAVLYAALAILVLSFIHVLGVVPGKRTQNLLTVAKVVGLGAIVAAGFCYAAPRTAAAPAPAAGTGSFGLAMLFVLYTYDGWNEGAYVAAEVHNRRRNLPLALILGTTLVALIYLLVNGAYLAGLGFDRARDSDAVAADVLALAWGGRALQLMCGLVMVSALGGINGMIFTGSRIYSELGADHRAFALLGRWSRRWQTPVWSIVIQAGICTAMVVAVGLCWQGSRGFEALLKCTAPVFWLFFLLTGFAVLVLRCKDRGLDRPFRVPLFPLTPLIFCGWCGYMFVATLLYARAEALVGLAILLPGLPLYWLTRRSRPVATADVALPEPARVGQGSGQG